MLNILSKSFNILKSLIEYVMQKLDYYSHDKHQAFIFDNAYSWDNIDS